MFPFLRQRRPRQQPLMLTGGAGGDLEAWRGRDCLCDALACTRAAPSCSPRERPSTRAARMFAFPPPILRDSGPHELLVDADVGGENTKDPTSAMPQRAGCRQRHCINPPQMQRDPRVERVRRSARGASSRSTTGTGAGTRSQRHPSCTARTNERQPQAHHLHRKSICTMPAEAAIAELTGDELGRCCVRWRGASSSGLALAAYVRLTLTTHGMLAVVTETVSAAVGLFQVSKGR